MKGYENPTNKHRFMRAEFLVKEIKGIKRELAMLKGRQEYIEDSLLSADDVKALAEARKDLKQRETISLPEVKRKLNL